MVDVVCWVRYVALLLGDLLVCCIACRFLGCGLVGLLLSFLSCSVTLIVLFIVLCYVVRGVGFYV